MLARPVPMPYKGLRVSEDSAISVASGFSRTVCEDRVIRETA